MEDLAGEKSMRQPPQFSGKADDFVMWWMRFTAYAVLYKFDAALDIENKGTVAEANLPASHLTVIDETTDLGKLQAVAKRRNQYAFASYTMAFTTESFFT